jgi:hypothetical protein
MDPSDDISNEDSKFFWSVTRKGAAVEAAIENKVGRIPHGAFWVR